MTCTGSAAVAIFGTADTRDQTRRRLVAADDDQLRHDHTQLLVAAQVVAPWHQSTPRVCPIGIPTDSVSTLARWSCLLSALS